MRYDIVSGEPIGDTKVYHLHQVRPIGGRRFDYVAVWLSPDGTARCASCSGPQAAMLSTCRHAKALKRYLGPRGGKP